MNKNIKRVACLIFAGILLCTILLMLTSCGPADAGSESGGFNYQLFDTTYTYDKAIIKLPDGEVVKGKVESWKDYEDGDQLQIKIDGKTYLVHSTNCVLINSGEKK